ncbi:MAG: hypothetical protein ACFB4J_07130 [Elainellaceae cyanobacterium]
MTQISIRLYATGDLADELMAYRDKVSDVIGAEADLPYCRLTSDFHPQTSSPTDCVRALDEAITAAPKVENAVVEVIEPQYTLEQHWLELSSSWVRDMVTAFVQRLGCDAQIIPQDSLQLILASPIDQAQHEKLRVLGEALDWSARAGWDVRLYQETDEGSQVEGTWPIQQP